jgi:U3 small nucleolar RNA-associated protein 22
VATYIGLLQGRLGHAATFCADPHGGRLVGVKWHAHAFLPAPPRVSTAHTALPLSLTGGGRRSGPPLAVPNAIQLLSEIAGLGEGLVEDVLLVDLARAG